MWRQQYSPWQMTKRIYFLPFSSVCSYLDHEWRWGVILQNKSASNSQRSSTGHAVASSYTQPHAQMNEYLVFLIIIFICFAYILNPPWHRHLILSWRLFLCVPFLQISLLNFPTQFTEQKELENLYNFHKSS